MTVNALLIAVFISVHYCRLLFGNSASFYSKGKRKLSGSCLYKQNVVGSLKRTIRQINNRRVASRMVLENEDN